jgi:glutamyl-tRNA reductase
MTQAMAKAAPQLFVVGYSHKTATIQQRELMSLPSEAVFSALSPELMQRAGLLECVPLITCNRAEFYGVTTRTNGLDAVTEALGGVLDVTRFERHAYSYAGPAVPPHLLRVASGLDSQMLGETEILGQIKAAYHTAHQRATVGAVCHRLMQKALQAAKWARTHTAIGKGQVSIGSVAVELTERVCGALEEVDILLVGTGEVGAKTAQALTSRGARRVTVTGRNAARATEIAAQFPQASVAEFRNLLTAASACDVILCCTSAPDAILTAEQVQRLIRPRSRRPLTLIDLAVPRDIEADAGRLDHVYLFNMDDLATLANENRKAREKEARQTLQSLQERADRLWSDLQKRLG